jgi:lipopolysaccharide biosynthesis glycosyltransferase
MQPLKVFIGFDRREAIAWQVLAHSILRRATQPVAIYPLNRDHLTRCYWRERGPTEATEFSLTRFLVPYLANYEGWALFLDCDMLCQADIGDLMLYPLAQPGKAVYVCQHDYIPKDLIKFDGHEQTKYPRKNWSSAVLFDAAKCTALTPEYVNTATGLELHRFHWLKDEQIGSLPLEWNYLVGEANQSTQPAKIAHFTNAGPWHEHYELGEYGQDWLRELDEMLGPTLRLEQPAKEVA